MHDALDSTGIDAVAAKLMGFDPLRDLKFVRLAHDLGLGCGDPRDIEIVGDTSAAAESWNFDGPRRPGVAGGTLGLEPASTRAAADHPGAHGFRVPASRGLRRRPKMA